MVLEALTSRSVSLPLIGTIGLPIAAVGALAFYFLVLKRKGRITSVTTRYRK